MRGLRLRTHSLLGVGLLLLLPWVFFVAGYFLTTHSLQLGENRPDSYAIPMVAAFVGLVAAFVVVGVQMRRLLLGPLEELGQASRTIAKGDWGVRLPEASIREIAEVRDGFESMVKELKQAQQQQTKLEEERRFLISAVAHDLRTPLFALRGYLDGLEQGIARTPEQIAKYVAVCKEKSMQLDRLVEDLFTFTKLEFQSTEWLGGESAVDFGDIMHKSIDSLKPQADERHIQILLVSAEPSVSMIRADSHLLERALSNLLDNAVRHTPVDGKIHVRYGREKERVVFEIHDSGQGFAAMGLEQGQVFEPLYRGEQSRNRATGGAGLGLTISQRIIRRHGGELKAGNHPSGGAVLSGWLPAE
ncbi:sensor histidine kinase [Paenibacillus koleovorans]|uniref:sensor histidine kinase n=1 Tax=Paenibacillus koleovorans TaxID=121608 RepID=UPI000FDABCFE|nr:HAMP domain-containing sensor histidine kinase [Paenibacillus koleovorans]